MFMNLMWAINS